MTVAAVITKLARVMLLGPYLLLLARFVNKDPATSKKVTGSSFPWFVVAFVAASFINSTQAIPETAKFLREYSASFILLSITALGVETNLSKVRAAGAKPFLLAAARAVTAQRPRSERVQPSPSCGLLCVQRAAGVRLGVRRGVRPPPVHGRSAQRTVMTRGATTRT